MKRPRFWRESKKSPSAPAPAEPVPPKTYQYSPRGDLDSYVKFFSGDTGAKRRDPD